MRDTPPPLPPSVPWTPLAGVVFLVILLMLNGLGSLLHLFSDSIWAFYAQLLLAHGLVLVAVFIFLFKRCGGTARLKKLCAFHLIRVTQLVKAAIIPGIIAIAALIVWFLIHSYLRQMLGYSVVEQPQIQFLRDQSLTTFNYELLAAILIMVIIAPVLEEILFRLLLYLPIRQSVGPVMAAVIVSLFFAVLHIFATENTFEFIMNALLITGHLFIVSLFFTVLLERTRTILAPIIGHILYNGLVISVVISGIGA